MIAMNLTALAEFSTPLLADAIDAMGFRVHNRGFTQPGLRRFTPVAADPAHVSVVGYAVTARIRASDTPVTGHLYFHHSAWWSEIDAMNQPRVVAIEDVDKNPGSGACIGEVGAAVFRALGCAGAITNGSVRDVAAVGELGFAFFAQSVSPSRGYAHLVEHSVPVTILGLAVQPGDVLAADEHGVLSIPVEALPDLAMKAAGLRAGRRSFLAFCRSDAFSIDEMERQLGPLRF